MEEYQHVSWNSRSGVHFWREKGSELSSALTSFLCQMVEHPQGSRVLANNRAVIITTTAVRMAWHTPQICLVKKTCPNAFSSLQLKQVTTLTRRGRIVDMSGLLLLRTISEPQPSDFIDL